MPVHTYTLTSKPIEPTEVIDSRDIIARLEELEEVEADAQEAGATLESVDAEELADLRKLASECEGYGDWKYGETIIRRDYFVRYIEELINDCYEMPREMNSGKWPFKHMTMDYEAAASEAEQDYMEASYNGHDYLMRR